MTFLLMALRRQIFILLLVATLPVLAEPSFPAFNGPVVDGAGTISAGVKQQLAMDLARYQKASGNQVVVVTLKSLDGYAIEEYGYLLGRHWGIGAKGKDSGVLMIVVPGERKARIEVGYGLEGTLTDALSREILERSVLPRLAAGQVDVALLAGSSEIVAALESGDAPEGQNVAAAATDSGGEAVYIVLLVVVLVLIVVGELIHRFVPERPRSGKIFGVLVGVIAVMPLFMTTGAFAVVAAPLGGGLFGWLGYRLHLLLGKIEEKYDVTWDPDPKVREQKRRELAEAQARQPQLSGWFGRKRGGSPGGGGGSFGGGGASGKW
jgi:uncharacterized protein